MVKILENVIQGSPLVFIVTESLTAERG